VAAPGMGWGQYLHLLKSEKQKIICKNQKMTENLSSESRKKAESISADIPLALLFSFSIIFSLFLFLQYFLFDRIFPYFLKNDTQ
jgi:hypothetical protein